MDFFRSIFASIRHILSVFWTEYLFQKDLESRNDRNYTDQQHKTEGDTSGISNESKEPEQGRIFDHPAKGTDNLSDGDQNDTVIPIGEEDKADSLSKEDIICTSEKTSTKQPAGTEPPVVGSGNDDKRTDDLSGNTEWKLDGSSKPGSIADEKAPHPPRTKEPVNNTPSPDENADTHENVECGRQHENSGDESDLGATDGLSEIDISGVTNTGTDIEGDNSSRDKKRRPTSYRPPTGKPPTSPRQVPLPIGRSRGGDKIAGNHTQAASIRLRILFERGGYCRMSLLPKRPAGLPVRITVAGPTGSLELVAFDDDWYQDIELDGFGDQLQNGFVWKDETTGQEWRLSGREVFVFGQGTSHSGFTSCPRLALQRPHVVVCTRAKLAAVEAALREAACGDWTQLEEDDGLPDGWVALKSVVPSRPVPLADDTDIRNVLRPLPAIEIALRGGIRLDRNTWLSGYPPSIGVYGDSKGAAILIDGQQAELSTDGGYSVPGWDEVGDHKVWCGGKNSVYSVVSRPPKRTIWPARTFSSSGNSDGCLAICGPIVRFHGEDVSFDDGADWPESIEVPSNNPVLLGSSPGDIYIANCRQDVRGASCIASPRFSPVWALPIRPLQCNKQSSRILLVGKPVEPGHGISRDTSKTVRGAPELWCRLILDAGRKGLSVESATPEIENLWRRYKSHARAIWKKSR